MSRIRLLAVCAGVLLVLVFATSAMAAGGGSSGGDNVKGSARADTMQLRGGDDVLTDDRGSDRFSGGDDTAIVDDDDIVRNCEHVTRVADDNGVDPAGDDKGGVARGDGADDSAGHR